jgi:hypothetical protein
VVMSIVCALVMRLMTIVMYARQDEGGRLQTSVLNRKCASIGSTSRWWPIVFRYIAGVYTGPQYVARLPIHLISSVNEFLLYDYWRPFIIIDSMGWVEYNQRVLLAAAAAVKLDRLHTQSVSWLLLQILLFIHPVPIFEVGNIFRKWC